MATIKFFPYGHRAIKNLFSKPVTKNYPAEPAHFPERMRGHIEIKIEDCISCGLCARKCPVQAIDLKDPDKVDEGVCISCMRCISVCPQHARAVDESLLAALYDRLSKVCGGRKEGELFL